MKIPAKVAWAGGGLLLAGAFGLKLMQARDNRHVQRIWRSLELTGGAEVFSPAMVADLPAPAQRYLRHALAPGTPLAASVQVTMTGTLRLGAAWQPFTAQQILTPGHGFVWQARARMGPVLMQGADYYARGSGRMRFALFGLLPLITGSGPDVTKSALGRLMIEAVMLPASFLPQRGVQWVAVDDEHASATVTVAGETTTLTFTIAPTGQLREVVMLRWREQEQAYLPFGVTVLEEQTFDGYTIPIRIRVGWWYGSERYLTEGEFFRATLTTAQFR